MIMATNGGPWYVRLPDGRTARARNSEVLRAFVRAGRIPWASQVRRSGDEAWLPLERIPAFAELRGGDLPPHAAHDSGELRGFGARSILEELLNAFDSCRSHAKLMVAAAASLVLALGVLVLEQIGGLPLTSVTVAEYAGTALAMLAAVTLASVLLTQITVIELDRHRPARAAEVRQGLHRHLVRVFLTQALVAGLLIGLILTFRLLPPWLAVHDLGDINSARDGLAATLAVLRPVVECICWPFVVVALVLLGPVLIIEDAAPLQGVREWLTMLRRHLGRIYLYEALAFLFAIALSLPLLMLVGLIRYAGDGTLSEYDSITLWVLAGLAFTPFMAYLMVANVFIYLNLRYEFFFSARER
jgi:hypothetical protein